LSGDGVVLLVEDDADLNEVNRRALELRRYKVRTARTLAEARAELGREEPDVILLDVMLPDGDGFVFCDRIRDRTRAHVLFLTAKTEHADLVRGLATGGDDYIAKPFHIEELLARVDAAMRRRRMGVPVQTLRKGRLVLDILAGTALVNGRDLALTPKEFALLLLFAENENKLMTAEHVYQKVWGSPMAGDRNAVQTSISRLRKKVAPAGYVIAARRGRGYVFEEG
jgi:DNA-binding response OmpR family regulator